MWRSGKPAAEGTRRSSVVCHITHLAAEDLKVEAYKPEFAGKMNFHRSAADDLLRHPADRPSIGLVLWKERDRVVVEYSLRDTSKAVGVAEYVLRDALPPERRDGLPSAAAIEAEPARVGMPEPDEG